MHGDLIYHRNVITNQRRKNGLFQSGVWNNLITVWQEKDLNDSVYLIKNTGNSDSNQDGIARTRLTPPPQTTRKLFLYMGQ